jgi:DUF4097 and DUF4098 domain-containing protein YvlB
MHAKQILTAVLLVGVVTTPAAAQPVDVRVKVDTQAIREVTADIREAIREAFGPEVRREIQREITSASRDIADVIEQLSRHTWTGDLDFGDLGRYSDSRGARQRNFPASQTDKETRKFVIGAGGEFDLDNLSGDIRIVPGSGRDLIIEISRHSRGRTEADAKTGLARVRVETTHRGERATARTVYPNDRQSNYSVSVDYVITAPAGTRITAKAISGDVTVGAMTGELTINSVSGDVQITGASRVLMAKTVSGDVVLTDCGAEGLLEASTMSGDVTGTNLKARRVELQSISGTVTGRNVNAQAVKLHSMSDDVVFDGDLASGGRYEFTSHSGTVRLSVDGRTGFTFEASTFSGSVRTDLPLKSNNVGAGAGSRRANRTVRGTFGDGSATVTANSFSGDVIVTKR